jgi:hypothetical protein
MKTGHGSGWQPMVYRSPWDTVPFNPTLRPFRLRPVRHLRRSATVRRRPVCSGQPDGTTRFSPSSASSWLRLAPLGQRRERRLGGRGHRVEGLSLPAPAKVRQDRQAGIEPVKGGDSQPKSPPLAPLSRGPRTLARRDPWNRPSSLGPSTCPPRLRKEQLRQCRQR